MDSNAQLAEIAKLQRQLAEAQAEVERARKAAHGALKLSVGKSGTVHLSGINRFGLSLYPEQWERVFTKIEDIKSFIEAHKGELSYKS